MAIQQLPWRLRDGGSTLLTPSAGSHRSFLGLEAAQGHDQVCTTCSYNTCGTTMSWSRSPNQMDLPKLQLTVHTIIRPGLGIYKLLNTIAVVFARSFAHCGWLSVF